MVCQRCAACCNAAIQSGGLPLYFFSTLLLQGSQVGAGPAVPCSLLLQQRRRRTGALLLLLLLLLLTLRDFCHATAADTR
jgi:hypothetical protein